jgi:hypothetical protein
MESESPFHLYKALGTHESIEVEDLMAHIHKLAVAVLAEIE